MGFSIRMAVSFMALAAFSAEAADVTGEWAATIVTAGAQKHFTYVFRQDGARLIGTVRSEDGVTAISSGTINYKTITFIENVTAKDRRAVLEYMGELISDTEIRFKRQTAGTQYPVLEFVATRVPTP